MPAAGTFRWVKGDLYVAVMRGTCVDARRVLIIKDRLAGHHVLETPQPLLDAIPVATDDSYRPQALRQLADSWAKQRRGACPKPSRPARVDPPR